VLGRELWFIELVVFLQKTVDKTRKTSAIASAMFHHQEK
jgi:hypothetical protein